MLTDCFAWGTYLNDAGTDSSAFSQLAMDLNKNVLFSSVKAVEYFSPTFKILINKGTSGDIFLKGVASNKNVEKRTCSKFIQTAAGNISS